MLPLKFFKNTPNRFSDLLPWATLIAPSVVLNKDGSFLSVIRLAGFDLSSATDAEISVICAKVNDCLMRLKSGWAIYFEAVNTRWEILDEAEFPDLLAELLFKDRLAAINSREIFQTGQYLTLVYLPEVEAISKFGELFLNHNDTETDYSAALGFFRDTVVEVCLMFETLFLKIELLTDSDLLSYLHAAATLKDQRICTHRFPEFLDGLIGNVPLNQADDLRVGDFYVKVVGVLSYPMRLQALMLDELQAIQFPYRFVTRFVCLSETEAHNELKKYLLKWSQASVNFFKAIFRALASVTTSSVDNKNAIDNLADVDEAISELQHGLWSFGFLTTNIVVWDKDKARLRAKADEVVGILNRKMFIANIEDDDDIQAYLSTIPGNCRFNIRRPLMSTANLTHLLPLSTPWSGFDYNETLKSPALLKCFAGQGRVFNLDFHGTNPASHFYVIGPTGAGKSMFLSVVAQSFLRHKNARVFVFDYGGSMLATTHGLGGQHLNLGKKEGLRPIQPLANIDLGDELLWAQGWVEEILKREHVEITTAIRNEVAEALRALAALDKRDRTIFSFLKSVMNFEIQEAFTRYARGGALGDYFDFDNVSCQRPKKSRLKD